MSVRRDTTEHELNMLREIHGGGTIEQVASRMEVSTTTVDNWRKDLKEGVEFLDSFVKVDFGSRGRMDTTVHPIFLPANSSEVYTLLMVLQEYARDHRDEPKGEIAADVAGKIYHQLTPYARGLVDGNLDRSGLGRPYPVRPDFKKDNEGGREPCYLTMLEKSGARVSVAYDAGEGHAQSVRGRLSCRPSEPGCVRVEPLDVGSGANDLQIEYDKILFVERLRQ